MAQLESFLATWEEEFHTTLRVFGSYPPERLSYRPHEISKTAHQLMWQIADEECAFVEGCIEGRIDFPRTVMPESLDALISDYQKQHQKMVARLRGAGEDLFQRTIKFRAGRGLVAERKVAYLLWVMLHDQIHHRGQLSVYLRLVGAKVPSIYGPSADEPW